MKTAKLIQLERDRLAIMGEARDLLREMNAENDQAKIDELGRKHDATMRSLDANQLDIEEEQMLQVEDEARAKNRPDMGGSEARGVDGGSHWGGNVKWQDKSGNEVRCLAPNERFATERADGPGLGQVLRAMVTGPRNEAEKRALSEGTDSAGGYTVPTPLAAEFIDKLRARSVLVRAGARTVPMTSETLQIAKLTGDAAGVWKAENAQISGGSDPTFGSVTLTAHTLIGEVRISRELLDDSTNVNEMLERSFIEGTALAFDYAGLYGSGSGAEPEGIVNVSGINSVSMGTNGAAFTDYDPLIDAIYALQEDNVEPNAVIWHPRTGRDLAKLKDADNNPLRIPEMVANLTKLQTTQMPIDETQGSASNASSAIVGDFSELMIGMRSQLRIELARERYADYHQYAFYFWMRGDFAPQHAEAFCQLAGIIPPA